MIHYYRTLIVNEATTGQDSQDRRNIAKGLYKYLIAPIEVHLKDKKELIIIPEGILGYLPFETLIDHEGKYLIEKYDVKYAHSASVWQMLNERNYAASRKNMLAFGGASYDGSGASASLIQSQDEIYQMRSAASTSADQDFSGYYQKMGIGSWEDLPGTTTEVENIQTLYPDADTKIACDASESVVKEMNGLGSLSQYKIIHFATHGVVTPEVPDLSALVLSQTCGKKNDGYLTAGEIEKLKFKADFVNLSACETGLGKIYGGEGVVGLTQSFLVAGANGLSVSLWQVADESTMKFMTGMYQDAKTRQSYPASISTIKRKFIDGSYGDKNKLPYYWAPFVYYGR